MMDLFRFRVLALTCRWMFLASTMSPIDSGGGSLLYFDLSVVGLTGMIDGSIIGSINAVSYMEDN